MTQKTTHTFPNFRPGDFILEPAEGGFGSVVAGVSMGRYCHVRLVVDPFGTTASAEDGGVTWEHSLFDGDILVSPPLTDEQRAQIAATTVPLIGTPYARLGMYLVGLARLGLRSKWLSRQLDRPDRLICSQLVDLVWRRVGFHAFDDGRQPQDVTPGDLADLAFRNGWQVTIL